MRFSILIKTSPYQQQGVLTAQRFIRAALAQGHQVWRVFFYHDGAYNGMAGSLPPQDESHVIQVWEELAASGNIELVICSAAGMRRGVVGATTGADEPVAQASMSGAFRSASLLKLVDAMAESDRFMVFEGQV